MDESSRSIEVSGRSVDEAVQQALEALDLSPDDVEIEVVRQGSRGLLGLLSEEAVVRVTRKATTSPPVEEPRTPPPAGTQDEVARLGIEVLQNLLRNMGIRGSVTQETASLQSQTDPAPVVLNISGEDLGVLIGRRGDTLRDLQYLTCLIVSRHTQRWPPVVVDVEHYKSRRERSLIDLARRMAERVRVTGQPMPLEPMPAYERRIVHLALRDDPDVFTESVGQDDDRKVVVMPRK